MFHTSHDYGRWNYHLWCIVVSAVIWSKFSSISVECIQLDPLNFYQEHLCLPWEGMTTSCRRDIVVHMRDWHSSVFSFRVVTLWNNLPSEVVSAPSVNTFKGRLDKYWRHHCYSLDPSVFVQTASEQPTGHSGLTSKTEEGSKVYVGNANQKPKQDLRRQYLLLF